nr:TDP-N-acetylfucosamine:lipid II N-acetylfucosaminyltransferase [Ramlibacter algicola]
MAWGSDYYHLLRAERELLLPRTGALVGELRDDPDRPARRRAVVGGHLVGLARAATQPRQAIQRYRRRRTLRSIGAGRPGEIGLLNRFRGFAVTHEDFDGIRQGHPAFDVPLLDWNCYWAESFDPDRCPDGPTGGDVLLGNSATPTNNHLEALELLADILPAGRRVVCPLSYGDARYGDAIESAGHRLLGDRFLPLREYMEPHAYAEVLGACSVVVMNHRRQQAAGNIVFALCSGAHVFLRAENSLVASLRRLGVDVHDMEGLADFLRRGGGTPVAGADLAAVRSRIGSRFGRPSILATTRAMLARLAQAHEREAA